MIEEKKGFSTTQRLEGNRKERPEAKEVGKYQKRLGSIKRD